MLQRRGSGEGCAALVADLRRLPPLDGQLEAECAK